MNLEKRLLELHYKEGMKEFSVAIVPRGRFLWLRWRIASVLLKLSMMAMGRYKIEYMESGR